MKSIHWRLTRVKISHLLDTEASLWSLVSCCAQCTTPAFVPYSSQRCWNVGSSGSLTMCILCDIIFTIFCCAGIKGPFFFLFFFLNFKDPSHLWGQCYVIVGFLCGKDKGLVMLAQNDSCQWMVCAAAFPLLCWVSEYHDFGLETLFFRGSVYFRAHWLAITCRFFCCCFFQIMLCTIKQAFKFGPLDKWMFAVVWKQILKSASHSSRYNFFFAVCL